MYCRYCGAQVPDTAKFCGNCGAVQEAPASVRPIPVSPRHTATPPAQPKSMASWKLVSGILSLAFSMIVLFQSCAAGIAGAFQKTETTGQEAGTFVGITLIVVGTISIAARKTRGGNIALIVLCAIGFLVGISGFGIYLDLIVWSIWLLVIGIMAVISLVRWNSQSAAAKHETVYSKPTWMK